VIGITKTKQWKITCKNKKEKQQLVPDPSTSAMYLSVAACDKAFDHWLK
jgi:hypothetical protein